MANRVQSLRSSVTGNRPTGRLPGELYVNWADNQLGSINATSNPQDLIAVRFFSTGANYNVGDHVIQGGLLYRAIAAVTAGAFNIAQWALAGGGGSITIGDFPPSNPQSGALWWDSVGGNLYVWYNDGTSAQWVIAVNTTSALPPATTTSLGGVKVDGTSIQAAVDGTISLVGGGYLPLTGGTMTGPINANGQTISANIIYFGSPTRTDFLAYESGGNPVLQWMGGYYMLFNASNGTLSWTQNNATAMSLDYAGNLSVAAGVTSNGFSNLGGWAVCRAPSSNTAYWVCTDSAGNANGYFYASPSNTVMQQGSSGGQLAISSDGNTYANARFFATGSISGQGLLSKAGVSNGADGGHSYNFAWYGNQNTLWLDASNWGQIQTNSDYRTKKDVTPLGSMWEKVKALKPISYTHKEFTPPSAKAKEDGSPADPMFVGDDTLRWGFLAHELQETLVESAANGVKDDPIHIQCPNPFTVIAALTKALQEAMQRIEALEASR